MFVLLVVLTLIAAVLLIGVVLIQKSKGGGLSSSFAGSNQIMGVRRTNSFIEKLTWSLAGIIVVLAVASSFCAPDTATRTGARVTSAPATEQTAGANYDQQAPAAPAAAEKAPAAPTTPAPEQAPAAPAAESAK